MECMPSYNLTALEKQVIVTWLFEPLGYLDVFSLSRVERAREALIDEPSLDITQWVRDFGGNGWDFNGRRYDSVGVELGMLWWIRANDQVNVTSPSKPPETAAWIAILQEWDASIAAGFARSPQQARNRNTVPTFDEAGVETSMPAGAQLAHQQQIISKVLGVLQ